MPFKHSSPNISFKDDEMLMLLRLRKKEFFLKQLKVYPFLQLALDKCDFGKISTTGEVSRVIEIVLRETNCLWPHPNLQPTLTFYQTTKLDMSKLKSYADDKRNATQKLKFVLTRVENTVGK